MSADLAAFTRVLVIAPRTRVDVALPTDVAIVEMMPQLLDMVGERSDDGGASHDGWHLLDGEGHELDPGRTLRALAVLDGSALRLMPTRPVNPDPIYDDVVEAIAAAVRERTPSGGLAGVVASVTGGVALVASAAALWLGAHDALAPVSAGVAGLGAVGSLVASGGLARMAHARAVAVVIGAAGSTLALVAGLLAIPGASTASGLLLGSVMAFVYAVLAGLVIRSGAVVLTAVATAAVLTSVGALSGVLWSAPASSHATIASVVALAALTFLPRLAVRLARLPLPMVPTSADQLKDEAANTDFAVIQSRSRIAAEYLEGTSLGCLAVAAVGGAVALSTGTTFGVLFGVAMIAALLLRLRSTPGRVLRIGMLVAGSLAGGGGLVLWAMRATAADSEATTVLAAVVGLALAGVATIAAAVGPRRRTSPLSGRSLDLLEGAMLITVLPLALGAINLYSTIRHL